MFVLLKCFDFADGLCNHRRCSIFRFVCSFKKTQVRPERQKLLNLKYKGNFIRHSTNNGIIFSLRSIVVTGANAPDDLKLGLLELKQNYKLMMVGSLESDIKDVESRPLDSLVVDDFEDTDEKKEISIHNSEVVRRRHESSLCFTSSYSDCVSNSRSI